MKQDTNTTKPPGEAKANPGANEPTPLAAKPDEFSSNKMKPKTQKPKEPGEAKANAGAMQTPSLAAKPDREEIETPADAPADASVQQDPGNDTMIKPGTTSLLQDGQDGKKPEVKNIPLTVTMARLSKLKVNAMNEKFYGRPQADERLKSSVAAVGIQQPLIVNKDGTLLSGHRRFAAATELGMDEIPIIRVDIPDPIDQMQLILSGNAQREKTNEEKAREFLGYQEIEAARGKARQGTNKGKGERAKAEGTNPEGKTAAKAGKKDQHVQKSSEAEFGKARDLAAERVGWSGQTAVNAAKVLAAIDELKKDATNAMLVEDLKAKLNKAVDPAASECKKLGLFKSQQKAPKEGKTDPTKHEGFLPSTRSYSAHDFNPFNGKKLNESAIAALKTRKPKAGEPQGKSAILSLPPGIDPLAKAFGEIVSGELGDAIEAAPQWSVLLETREYKRAANIDWPDNAWIGLVVSTQKEVEQVEAIADSITAKVRWVHCRLDAETLFFSKLDAFDWIVVTLDNERVQWADVEPVLLQARKGGCRVFFDPGVKCRLQEFPKPAGKE